MRAFTAVTASLAASVAYAGADTYEDLYARADPAPASPQACSAVSNAITASGAASTATQFCSSYLGITTASTTTTVTNTDLTTVTSVVKSTATVTADARTITFAAYTYTSTSYLTVPTVVFSYTYPPPPCFTGPAPDTSFLTARNVKRNAEPLVTPAAEVVRRDAPQPACLSGVTSSVLVSSACSCLSLTTPTTTITSTVTTAVTTVATTVSPTTVTVTPPPSSTTSTRSLVATIQTYSTSTRVITSYYPAQPTNFAIYASGGPNPSNYKKYLTIGASQNGISGEGTIEINGDNFNTNAQRWSFTTGGQVCYLFPNSGTYQYREPNYSGDGTGSFVYVDLNSALSQVGPRMVFECRYDINYILYCTTYGGMLLKFGQQTDINGVPGLYLSTSKTYDLKIVTDPSTQVPGRQ